MSRSSLLLFVVATSLVCACSSSSTTTPSSSGTDAGTVAQDSGASATAATFTDVYTKVIAVKCAGCHTTAGGEGITGGKLDMTSQATAYTNLVNAKAAGSACGGKGTRVTPGMPDDSVMYLKVSLDDPTPCGEKMPLGRAALAQNEADMIESWINDGAKNN